MHILFAASEMAPLAKVGGLGDVIGSLPKALVKLGVKVTVALPRYEMIPREGLARIGNLASEITLYRITIDNVELLLLENNAYLSRGPIYFSSTAFADTKKELERFVFFSRGIAELLRKKIVKPDIIHCHDWHTGALVQELKTRPLPWNPKIIFTIHNLGNQGIDGDTNWMAEGIKNADMVTTVSPTYAKEILTAEYGEKLEPLLKARAAEGNLAGILNGIDNEFWNPKTDPYLKMPYDASRIAEKQTNKKALIEELRLASPDAPTFGFIARLTSQKGVELILENVPLPVKEHGAQFVFLGKGALDLEASVRALEKRFPANVALENEFNEPLAHRIYAGSDFFLMPSRFEPCGLGQMVAMRYGTPPLVRDTGGLHDSVEDEKTGLVFGEYSPHALGDVMARALEMYRDRARYAELQKNCLAQNFDFSRSAKKYQKLYEQSVISNQ